MKFAVRLLVLGLLFSMYLAAPAAAQYMRITTDNPTDNTRLNASGTTVLTITLDTNHDKDGSLQTCNSHTAALCGGTGTASALTLFSYQIYLAAVGGTVAWGTFVPADAAYTPLQPQVSNTTDVEFTFARPPGSTTPAGLSTLGSIPVTIVTGAPRIDIARFPNSPLDPSSFGTSFGTQCDGSVIGNTYILGNADDPCGLVSLLPPDWFDADGAGPPAGANSAPTLAQLTNMTIDEGATADQTLNATDPDNDPISFSLVTGPSFVTVTTTTPGTGTATGNLHLAPGFADDGTYSVTVRATDNDTGTDDQTLSITVNNINRAPVLDQPANMTVDEGETADQTITATDPDGEPLNFIKTAGPVFFSVTTTTPGTGSATGNIHLAAPGFDESGTFSATVRVSDGTDFDEASFTITVNDVDRPVVLNAIPDMIVNAGTTADQAFTAADADGDAITFSHTGPAFMTRTDDAQVANTRTGTIHLAPPLGTTGTFAASVTATANGTTSTENFVITITGGANVAPILTQPVNMTVNEGATADQVLNATDDEGNPITFTLVSGPAFATVTTTSPGTGTATGNLHLAPDFTDAGTYSVTVRASDGTANDDATLTVTVNNVNRTPTLQTPADMTVTEGATADQTLTASDADDEPLTFTMLSGPTFATVTTTSPGTGTGTGNLHLAPGSTDSGTYSVTVRVSDGTANDDKTLIVTVNEPTPGNEAPVLTQPADMTVNEAATADQTLNATDANGDPLTFTLVTGPTFATVTTTSAGTGTATGNLNLAPGFGDAGTYSATVRVSDGALSDDATLSITVNNVNRAPVLDAVADMTVTEGATADQTLNATDPDGDPLTFTLASGPTFATVTTTSPGTGTATGNLNLAPGSTDSGTYPATVMVSDGTLSDTDDLTITVNEPTPGNEAPVLIQPTDMTVDEGATANQTLNATDANGDPLTFTLVTGPTFATVTTTTPGSGTAAGNLNLAPGFGDAGTYSVTVRVSDGALSDDATLSITVNNVNRAPVLTAVADMTVTEGATADQTLNATDPDGDPLTFTLASGPTFATVTTTTPGTGTATGNLNLAPGTGDAGTYNASVTVSDGTDSDTDAFVITVNEPTPGNVAPVLTQPADMTVNEGATANQTLNATDANGDPLSFTLVTGPTFATVTTTTPGTGTATGNLNLAPGFGDAGTYSVTVRVSDGALSDDATLSITVNDVNRPPVADAGGPYTGTVNVAVNFSGTGSSDPDGDALTYSWDFDAADGITEDATGPTPTHTYTASGTYTVTLTVTDDGTPALSDTDTATATISPAGGGLQAEAVVNGGNRVIVLDSPRPFWCVFLSSNSFDVSDVVESSVQASFGGVQIPALRSPGQDENGENGPGDDVERLRICFSKDQLRILFASLADGSHSVDVLITGSLDNGATFQATVEVVVVKGGQANQALNGNSGNGKAKGWHRASPNPFNPNTTISFELSRPGTVRLQIYDVTGRLVKTLANEFRGSGVHNVSWNGMSRNGSRVSSGVYFYVLQTPDHRVKSQLVVMK